MIINNYQTLMSIDGVGVKRRDGEGKDKYGMKKTADSRVMAVARDTASSDRVREQLRTRETSKILDGSGLELSRNWLQVNDTFFYSEKAKQ